MCLIYYTQVLQMAFHVKHVSLNTFRLIVPILDVLWQAVKRRLLALGLDRVISFSGGLFGGSGELASKCVPSQKI